MTVAYGGVLALRVAAAAVAENNGDVVGVVYMCVEALVLAR